MNPMTTKTKLAAKINDGKFALTAECLPPRGADAAAVGKLAASLPPSLDAVIVADNPDEVRSGALATAVLLTGQKLQPILSLVTRDRNRIALESEALGAAALGIHSFLCLSGDHQTLGASPKAAGANDLDSIQLTQALGALAGGVGFAGDKLPAPCELFLGAAAHPYLRPMELNLIRLKKKIAAGARFLLTQAVFDLAGFGEWLTAVKAAGLDKKVAILASVLPLTGVEQAKKLASKKTYGPIGQDVIDRLAKSADPAREGVAIACEMAGKLKAMPGVAGIHILCGGSEQLASAVIKEAGLA